MTRHRRVSSIAVLVAAILVYVLTGPAPAQSPFPADIASVSVRPANTERTDPNFGQWFVLSLAHGEFGTGAALITNVADVPQKVKLYLSDLVFDDKGNTAVKEGSQEDVGAWGGFIEPNVILQPGETVEAKFEIRVPNRADPGDHVGAVVAESSATTSSAALTVVKRVATRLYVTVPGEATRSLQISAVQKSYDLAWWPREVAVKVNLRNTGRVRLHPKVTVGEVTGEGPETLLSRSVESYLAVVPIPWYGGRVKAVVVARADGGLIRRVDSSFFVVPWLLIAMVVSMGAIGYGTAKWWRGRVGRLAALHSDIRRLEALIAERPHGVPAEMPFAEDDDDATGALLAAIKRARRTNSIASLARLALTLHETGADALDVLMESLQLSDPDDVSDELIEATKSYGMEKVKANQRFGRLPEATREWLEEEDIEPEPKTIRPKIPPKTQAAKPPRANRKPVTPKHKHS